MTPNAIKLLLHLGSLIKTLKDFEKGIQDLVQGKSASADLQSIVLDLTSLFQSGVITLPGVSSDQAASIIGDIQKALS
jgi:hypothetical protein